ncbi:hypothetical protein BGZ88_005797 [Linnemannia elongata]|nr:hypothetical protein BGZ88_005797 [Linnemannia elongata]
MSFPTRRLSVSNNKKGTATGSNVPAGHRDIWESFTSPEPQGTKYQSPSAPQPTQPRQTKPFKETSSEDPNTLVSIRQNQQSTDSTPPVASPSRLTRTRVKEQQREHELKPPSPGNPTPPTTTGTKRRSSQTQPPTLDNVTTRWSHLTRGIPAPGEPGESRATKRKSRKLTGRDSALTTPFGASGQKAITPSALVSGNEYCLDQDDPDEAVGLHQIASNSSISRSKKTAARGQR